MLEFLPYLSLAMLALTVNGHVHETRMPHPTLAQLLDELALSGKRIAVELNGRIVPRSAHANTHLAAGDRLEIVGAVGGG